MAFIPPVGFHFKVKFSLDGLNDIDTRFQEVAGINSELAIEELEEGGENRFIHRLPKRPKYGNLVLKRGLLTNSKLISWLKDAIENFTFNTTNVTVTLLNQEHQPLGYAFNFVGVWPVKWSVSDFKAQENSIVIETLELAYQHFGRVEP